MKQYANFMLSINKLNTIKANIQKSEIGKRLSKEAYYSIDSFISDCQRYILAIKQGRIINSIGSVSNIGMSRTVKFYECIKYKNSKTYTYCNFYALFRLLGYTQAKEHGYFRINGCGMNMVFHTNYCNIHTLHRLGFINKKDCSKLAQMTPATI